MRASLAAALTLSLGLTACSVRNEIELGLEARRPLQCVDTRPATPEFLAERVTRIDAPVLFVFDVLTLPTFPRCSPGSILDLCEGSGCALAFERRFCVEVPRARVIEIATEVGGAANLRPIDLLADHDLALFEDAPDGPVILRLVGTLEEAARVCPEAGASGPQPFDLERVLGCAYSCPATLDDVRGRIDLDFDGSFGTCTLTDVIACANFLTE